MSSWLGIFEHPPSWSAVGSALALAFVIAWAGAQLVVWLIRRILPRSAPGAPLGSHPSVRALIRLLRIAIFLALLMVDVPPALDLFGVPVRAGLRMQTVGAWAVESGLRVLFIVALAAVLSKIVGITTARFQQTLSDARGGAPGAERQKRTTTVSGLVANVARAFIFVAAAVMILDLLHIDTQPLLASAGIVGLGIGFGAQSLVKDVISGFFLIVDDQIRVGDVAEINGTGGLVEAINLRTIVLRDFRGAVNVFPCGSVTTMTNLTKDFAYAVLDVNIAYSYDTDQIAEVLREVGTAIHDDPTYAPVILEPVEVLGIERFGELGVVMRARMKTLPAQQWNIGRELRRRVKQAFDARGIQIPVTNAPPAQRIAADSGVAEPRH